MIAVVRAIAAMALALLAVRNSRIGTSGWSSNGSTAGHGNLADAPVADPPTVAKLSPYDMVSGLESCRSFDLERRICVQGINRSLDGCGGSPLPESTLCPSPF